LLLATAGTKRMPWIKRNKWRFQPEWQWQSVRWQRAAGFMTREGAHALSETDTLVLADFTNRLATRFLTNALRQGHRRAA